MDAHALTDFKQTNVSTAEKRLQEAMMKLKTKLETKEGDNANSGKEKTRQEFTTKRGLGESYSLMMELVNLG